MSERILSETRGQSQVIWPFTNYLTRGSFGDFADDFAGKGFIFGPGLSESRRQRMRLASRES